jgi:hypothetical protein
MRIGPRPRPSDRAFAAAIALLAFFAAAAATATGAPVSEAASFYHQGRFDSALTRLDALKSAGGLKRRDSLSLFQYLGMASARLGRVPEAEEHFTILLGLDSLFQFPRNEDPAVLSAFARARAQRSAPRAAPSVPTAAQPFQSMGPTGVDWHGASASPAPSTPSAAANPQRGERGEDKSPALAGMTPPDIGAYGAAGETGPAGRQTPGNPPRIGLALGAMPFGTGWFVRNKFKHGLALGILQTGGLALSIYASNMQTRIAADPFRIQDMDEHDEANRWQWVQRVSLSTALGAYVFSLIASAGD